MKIDRFDLKMRAKASMQGAYPHPMLIALVFLVVTSGLRLLVTYFIGDPLADMRLYLLQGYTPDVILSHYMSGNYLAIYLILNLLLGLYISVVSFGYTSYALRLARGESPSFQNLLDGFYTVGRVLSTAILIAVFVCLWGLLGMIPCVLVTFLAAYVGNFSIFWTFIDVIALIALCAFLISIIYRYWLAYYFLLDHPEIGALEAIRRSKQAMDGHKWEMFVLELSFLGWVLLVPFTLGILLLWLTPYMSAAEANFYDAVTGWTPPQAPALDGDGSAGI